MSGIKRVVVSISLLLSCLFECGAAFNYHCLYPCACDKRPRDPVCAANGRTFTNQCYLDLYNKNLGRRGIYVPIAYPGPCHKSGGSDYATHDQYNSSLNSSPYQTQNDTDNVSSGYPDYAGPNVGYPPYSPYFRPSYGPPINRPPSYVVNYQPSGYIYTQGNQNPVYNNYSSPMNSNMTNSSSPVYNVTANSTELYEIDEYYIQAAENSTGNPYQNVSYNSTSNPYQNVSEYLTENYENVTEYLTENPYQNVSYNSTGNAYQNVSEYLTENYENVTEYLAEAPYENVTAEYYTTTAPPNTTLPNVPPRRKLPPYMFVQFPPPPPPQRQPPPADPPAERTELYY